MHEKLAKKIEQFRNMGVQFSFDGFAVADFLTQLDDLVEIRFIEFKNSRLSILLGIPKVKTEDFYPILSTASFLNPISSSLEDTTGGIVLWFEWMLPKDIYFEQQI
jgi:hypothetical protein